MAAMNFQIPSRAVPVTPSDTDNLPPTFGFYVGVTGNVTVETEGGDITTFVACPVGLIVPLRIVKVLSTGTTASSIVRFGSEAGASVGVMFLTEVDGDIITEVDGDRIEVPPLG